MEKVYFGFHPSRLVYWKRYLLSLIIILVGSVPLLSLLNIVPVDFTIAEGYDLYIFSILPLIGLIPLSMAEISRHSDLYVLTDQRIIEKTGIFNIRENSVEWRNVVNYTFTQSFAEKLFSIGTIRLYSAGGVEQEAELVIKKTSHIKKIKLFLDKLIQKE
jgi:uncharacterized membrane protein YdbT with pleckstrin-like domain